MAPPTLYDEQAQAGLMRPGAEAPPFEIGLRGFFWAVVVVLGAVELGFELAL